MAYKRLEKTVLKMAQKIVEKINVKVDKATVSRTFEICPFNKSIRFVYIPCLNQRLFIFLETSTILLEVILGYCLLIRTLTSFLLLLYDRVRKMLSNLQNIEESLMNLFVSDSFLFNLKDIYL